MLKYLQPLLITVITIFAPAKSLVIAAFAMVMLDLVTGLWAAKRRQEPITSNGWKRTSIKLAVYEAAILMAFVTETYLVFYLFPVAKVVSSFVGITEFKSCLENLDDISGGSLLASLIKKLNGPDVP